MNARRTQKRCGVSGERELADFRPSVVDQNYAQAHSKSHLGFSAMFFVSQEGKNITEKFKYQWERISSLPIKMVFVGSRRVRQTGSASLARGMDAEAADVLPGPSLADRLDWQRRARGGLPSGRERREGPRSGRCCHVTTRSCRRGQHPRRPIPLLTSCLEGSDEIHAA